MADFEIDRPSPDEGHEAIRLAVLQAIADSGDGFYLVDVLFELLEDANARLTALENLAP